MQSVCDKVDYNIYKNLTFDYEPKMIQYIDKEVFHKDWDILVDIYHIIHRQFYDEY